MLKFNTKISTFNIANRLSLLRVLDGFKVEITLEKKKISLIHRTILLQVPVIG